jgi:hypothetical protein
VAAGTALGQRTLRRVLLLLGVFPPAWRAVALRWTVLDCSMVL